MGLFDELNALDEQEDSVRAGFIHAPTKYCGNKFESLKEILPRLPYLNGFTDVFGGSGQVLSARVRSRLEVYNDRHTGMSAFYRVLQDRKMFDVFFERLEFLQHSRELFYAFKEEYDKPDQSLVDRAVKWYYMVQVSFGGKGLEFGRVKKGKSDLYNKIIAYFPNFEHFHERFKGVQVENLDWYDCIKDYDGYDMVFYLDPPYWESNQYVCTMNKIDHMRMCDLIFDSKGFFALSGYANDLYDKYPWDNVFNWEVSQNFQPSEGNVNNVKRTDTRLEYLWIKEVS